MKRKLAIWMPGGIGGGRFSQGIPVISDLVTQLARDYDITVFSYHPPNPDFRAKEFRVVTVNGSVRNLFRWISLIFLFVRMHQRERFSLLYSFWGFPCGFVVVFLAKMFRRPSIVHLQGGDVVYIKEKNYGSLKSSFSKKLAKWTYMNATELIALTRYQREFVTRLGVRRDIHVIPFGIDLSRFPFKPWDYDSNRELRCLHIANQSSVKDQETLLKAFALVSKKVDARLRIAGDHFSNGILQKYCDQLSIADRVEFNEPVHNSELHKLYTWADVFILTSVYEGQGIVVSEAAAAGNLLTGTSVGLLSDLGDECVVLVTPCDFEKLAEKIEQSVGNPEVVRLRLHAARSWVQQHDVNWSVTEVKNIIKKFL